MPPSRKSLRLLFHTFRKLHSSMLSGHFHAVAPSKSDSAHRDCPKNGVLALDLGITNWGARSPCSYMRLPKTRGHVLTPRSGAKIQFFGTHFGGQVLPLNQGSGGFVQGNRAPPTDPNSWPRSAGFSKIPRENCAQKWGQRFLHFFLSHFPL